MIDGCYGRWLLIESTDVQHAGERLIKYQHANERQEVKEVEVFLASAKSKRSCVHG
jgi:hypothetical protein